MVYCWATTRVESRRTPSRSKRMAEQRKEGMGLLELTLWVGDDRRSGVIRPVSRKGIFRQSIAGRSEVSVPHPSIVPFFTWSRSSMCLKCFTVLSVPHDPTLINRLRTFRRKQERAVRSSHLRVFSPNFLELTDVVHRFRRL
jgi:hypothetical protein